MAFAISWGSEMNTRLLAAFVLCMAALSANAKSPVADDVHAAVKSSNGNFSDAFGRGDVAAVAALYSQDGMLLPPGTEMAKGRKAIEEFWTNARAGGVKSVVLSTIEIEQADRNGPTTLRAAAFNSLS